MNERSYFPSLPGQQQQLHLPGWGWAFLLSSLLHDVVVS